MTKPDLFAECRRLAPDFALAWMGDEVRATCSLRGLSYIIAHKPVTSNPQDAECTVMHGLLDAVQLLGGHAHIEEAAP